MLLFSPLEYVNYMLIMVWWSNVIIRWLKKGKFLIWHSYNQIWFGTSSIFRLPDLQCLLNLDIYWRWFFIVGSRQTINDSVKVLHWWIIVVFNVGLYFNLFIGGCWISIDPILLLLACIVDLLGLDFTIVLIPIVSLILHVVCKIGFL